MQRGGKKLNMIDGLFLCGPAGRSCLFLTVRFAPAGAGPSFRVNEKKQKVTQGTTFLENPPSLRGCLVTLRPLDWLVCCQCRGPVPVLTSAHSSTEGRHCRLRRQRPSRQPAGLPGCRAARGSGVLGCWGVRACLISQRVRLGEGIFCPARQKAAAILTDCKGF